MKLKKGKNKGFTLVELIIVVAVIAVLASVLAPQYLKYVERTREANDAQVAAAIMDAAVVAMNDPGNFATAGERYRVVWFTNSTAFSEGYGGWFNNSGSARNSLGAVGVGPGEGSIINDFWLGYTPVKHGWSTLNIQEDVSITMGIWNTTISDVDVIEAESALAMGQNLVFDIHSSTGEITIADESSDWRELLGME